MIHICYALHDNNGKYSKFVGTSILSVFENTREKITIHLFHDDTLSILNRKKFVDIVREYDQNIVFHDVEDLVKKWEVEFEKIPAYARYKNRRTVAGFYKYFIQILLDDDISKTIYLDADTIINLDIKNLWDIDLENFPIAAWHEVQGSTKSPNIQNGLIDVDGYINGGILVLNLDQLRDESKYGREFILKNGLEILTSHPEINEFLDQETISLMFKNNMYKLPNEYNMFAFSVRQSKVKEIGSWILHYVGRIGLLLYANDPASMLFWKHFIKTPFCTVETFENLHTECVRVFNNSKRAVANQLSLIQKVVRLSITRPRVFFMNPADADEIKQNFCISKKVYAISSEQPDAHQKLIAEMKNTNLNSDKKSVYYLHVDEKEYPQLKNELIEAGFVEYEDFFNSKTLFNSATKRLPNSGYQANAM